MEINKNRKNKKVKQGKVVSQKSAKTGIALVERIIQHPIYKRNVKISKRFMFHDEENQSNTGDVVRIVECKPISKNKHWRLLEIVKVSEVI